MLTLVRAFMDGIVEADPVVVGLVVLVVVLAAAIYVVRRTRKGAGG
jgi:hypothetical protein